MKKGTILFLLIAVLGLLGPAVSFAQQPLNFACEEEYTVQAGDWLSRIAEKYFGDVMAYPALVEAGNVDANDVYTDIVDPNWIEPGWILCIPSGADVAALLPLGIRAVPEGLSLPELANATYTSEWTEAGTAPLTNGQYSEPVAPGSDTATKVIMLTEKTIFGQLNGREGAAVILVTSPGGSGTFYSLHLMVNQNGQPTEVAKIFLGDRVRINSVEVENNEIVVDMIQAGPNDPLCCPNQHVIKTFALQGEQLVETSGQVIDSKSPGANSGIVGVVWKWLGFTDPSGQNDIVVPNPDNYRLEFLADGTFRAKADCNVVSGSYALSGNNLALDRGPSTMVECGPNSLYDQYLVLFDQVIGYVQNGDNLVLNLVADGGNMNFSRLHAVTGTVVGPAVATLPAGAVLEVKVMDVTADTAGTQMGGVLQDVTLFPIDFEAPYNPRAVDPGHSYVLDVAIQDRRGNLLYQTSQPYPVLTQGSPTYRIVVIVEAVK